MMRARSILILHEYQSARTRLGDDVGAVARTLRSRAVEFAYAHVPRDRILAIDTGNACAGDPIALDVFRQSRPLASIDLDAFAGLVICDHTECLTRLGTDAAFGAVVRAFFATDRPIVAVGHVPGALAGVRGCDDRSLIAGRRVTFATRCDDAGGYRISPSNDVERAITNAGALVKNERPGDEHVSVDAYLITAQNRLSATTATRTILTFLDPISQSRKRAS